jgi:hypothetical protein
VRACDECAWWKGRPCVAVLHCGGRVALCTAALPKTDCLYYNTSPALLLTRRADGRTDGQPSRGAQIFFPRRKRFCQIPWRSFTPITWGARSTASVRLQYLFPPFETCWSTPVAAWMIELFRSMHASTTLFRSLLPI